MHGHAVGVVVGQQVYPYGGFDATSARRARHRVSAQRRGLARVELGPVRNQRLDGRRSVVLHSERLHVHERAPEGRLDLVGWRRAVRGISEGNSREDSRRARRVGARAQRTGGFRGARSHAEELAAELATPDVLAGPHGDPVRRAAADRAMMLGIVDALRPVEREMIPDIRPTVDALAQRVGSVATTLHRLDADVSGASLGKPRRANRRTDDGAGDARARAAAVAAAAPAVLVARAARATAVAGESARERRVDVTELEARFAQVPLVGHRLGDRGSDERDAGSAGAVARDRACSSRRATTEEVVKAFAGGSRRRRVSRQRQS